MAEPKERTKVELQFAQPVAAGAAQLGLLKDEILRILDRVGRGEETMSDGRQALAVLYHSIPAEDRRQVAQQCRDFAARLRTVVEALHQEFVILSQLDV